MTAEMDASVEANSQKPTHQIKPNSKCKFSSKETQHIIHEVLTGKLNNVIYNPETCSQLTKEISDEIKDKLKAKEWPRYKYIVNVTIGEIRGEGVRIGCRCIWDTETDNYAQDVFKNDSLFCVGVAYGIYYY